MTEEKNSFAGGHVIDVNRQVGIVDYWEHLNQFVINFSIKGSFDSQYSGVTGQLNKKFQKPGLKVLVSGKMYKTADLPAPMLGGQEIFFLEISEISTVE